MSVVGKSKVELVYSLAHNQAQREMLARRLIEIVRKSFDLDQSYSRLIVLPQRTPTQAEIMERTNIVFDWFLRLRGDMNYSLPKTLDLLPTALSKQLLGEDWKPPPADRAWGERVDGHR